MSIHHRGPLPPLQRPRSAAAGGWTLFEGTVRSPNLGVALAALEYEGYPEMIEAEGERILAEARERWDLTAAVLRHATGTLAPGECAIQAGALASHREEAFLAARWILEAAKSRLPVWKRELVAGG